MYAILNTVQAMRLLPSALVMDVGSGPGWVTQILVGLGYRVVALDPSRVMNDLARR
jgi:SAM-dependent methyltransferase